MYYLFPQSCFHGDIQLLQIYCLFRGAMLCLKWRSHHIIYTKYIYVKYFLSLKKYIPWRKLLTIFKIFWLIVVITFLVLTSLVFFTTSSSDWKLSEALINWSSTWKKVLEWFIKSSPKNASTFFLYPNI